MNDNVQKFSLVSDYHDSGQMSLAIELLLELLSESPDEPLYHATLASCLTKQARISAAEYENKLALGLDPSIPMVHLTQARICIYQRKLRKSLEACNEALRHDPELVDAYILKSTAYSILYKDDEVRRNFDLARALDANRLSTISAYGDYQFSTGHHTEAMQLALEALKIEPSDSKANVLMGKIQLAQGNREQADHHARVAIMQNPRNKQALALFADIQFSKNWFSRTWWQVKSWMTARGKLGAAIVLIGGYLFFNLNAEIARDLDHPTIAFALRCGWLTVILYSLISIPIYYKVLGKKLESFNFNSGY